MTETLSVYIPMDRRQALARNQSLPDRALGAALFADISGFTPLTEALVNDLGQQRGAEELTRHLNRVYDALIAELHLYGGSVISFSGDAITCWLEGDDGRRALACALAMQTAMQSFAAVATPSGRTVALAMKVAVAAGTARRFLVGDPEIQIIDALAGALLDRLVAAEHQAHRGEVVLDPETTRALAQVVDMTERLDEETGQRYGVVTGLRETPAPRPWPALPPDALADDQVSSWLLPQVYERLRSGQGEFITELRPAVVLFLRFGGIDYDDDADAGARLDEYICAVQQSFRKYDGTLLQLTIGDKGSYLYAAFGAPLAHEDDAVRAASAALELRNTKPAFITEFRIGVSQGRMLTGAYGAQTSRTYGILGDDVNLAARLMQAAAPNQILVSRSARQASGEAFAWEALPELQLKGKARAVEAFSLLAAQSRHAQQLHEINYAFAMVGRHTELKLIEKKLALARQGHGQIIGVVGEAGIGKSRLLAEVIRLAMAQQVTGYGGGCESYGTNTRYLVWQNIWRGLFDLDSGAPVAAQVQALETRLARIDPALPQRLPLLGAVLNLDLPDSPLTQTFDAKLRKTSLQSLLVDCLRDSAASGPLMLVLEDCHWLDQLSHELLEVLGRAIADMPVLLVLTYRPTMLSVNQLPHFTEVPLTGFTSAEAGQLINAKLQQTFGIHVQTPRDFVEELTKRAEGNPFYLEELLNYLQDRGLDPQNQATLKQLELPTSLHSLILSRIDQLTENQKILLKLASVIGRQFKAAMLWGAYPQLSDQDPGQLHLNLQAINHTDLTAEDMSEPELAYLFKSIVTQEVAYESLPYATRAVLHDQIGQYIERTYSDTVAQYLNLLAFHYDRSQNEAKQREYLLKAGEAAQAGYDNQAAVTYYQRVLPLLPAAQQVNVMRQLGQVFETLGTWGEAAELYHQAMALAEQLGDHTARARCQTSLAELSRKRGQYAEAAAWLERARQEFEALHNEDGVAQTFHYGGSLAAQQGDYETARRLYEQSLEIRRRLDDKPRIASLLSNLGIVARYKGEYAHARQLHEEGLAIRRALGDKWAIAISLNNLGNVALDEGDYKAARTWLEEATALQGEVGDRWYKGNSMNNLGNVARAQGDYATAANLYRDSLIINRELGDKWALAYLLEDSGALAALQGQPLRAFRLVGAASALREAIGSPLSSVEQAKLERLLEPARKAIPPATQATSLAEGKAFSLAHSIEYALMAFGNTVG